MIRCYLSCRIENSPDLLDMISKIKWMEVLKSISPKKNFTALFFLQNLPQVLARVHAIQLFFGIVSPHGNVDSREYKLL